MNKARRYNKGKLRYELLPEQALKDLAEVYTKGAEKYTIYNEDLSIKEDGANNWKQGLPWMDMIASVERHIRSFKQGEDIDPDLGTKHLANAAWGLLGILEYYKIAPQFDNRDHSYLKKPKISLDIDEVLADWVGHWTKHHKQEVPTCWNFDRFIKEKFELLKDDKEFWLSIPVKTKPEDIPFEPHSYITSRSIPKTWTEEWLDKNGFPAAPVYCVDFNHSKIDVAKESGTEIMVDDRFENFVELNNAGICTYLFDSPHNQRYDVGYKRIFNLNELK